MYRNAALKILASEEPKAAWVLADDRTPLPLSGPSSRSTTLGRALFADSGAMWYGKVGFDDMEAVERFEDYVRWER